KLGLTKGDRIGLMVSNHPYYIVSYYAAMKLGLIVVQVNPRYTTRELLQIANDAEPKCIVVEGLAIQTVNKVKDMYTFEHIFVIDGKSSEGLHVEELVQSTEPLEVTVPIDVKEDVAVIQYTGGTTGSIKGAMLTHYNLVANIHQSHGMFGKDMRFGKEIVLTATPLYHVYAMTTAMNQGIYLGATILLIKKFEVGQVLEVIEKYRPTFFHGVPKMYNAIVNYKEVEKYNLSSLKFCSCGS